MKLDQTLKKLFAQHALFNNLNEKQQKSLAAILNNKTFNKSDVIVREGDPGDKMYIIIKGSAEVLKENEALAVLHEGDTIGEMSLFDCKLRSADVIALEATDVIFFDVADLERLSDGQQSVESKVKLNFAVKLSQNLRSTNVQTIADRKKFQDQITFAKNFDEESGLANENLLQQEIEDLVVEKVGSIALYLFEITDFESVSALINNIADRLQEFCSDARLIARISKNQFAVLREDKRVERASEQIRGVFALPFNVKQEQIALSINIGCAFYPDNADSAKELIEAALLALDTAKFDTSSAITKYDKSMKERLKQRRQLLRDMQEGLENNQFLLYYQPQIKLADGSLAGAEALVRWQHPERGMVSPADFIPAAESSGLIIQLGDWIIKEGCRQAKIWSKLSASPVRIAINLSAKQFNQKNLVQEIKQVIKQGSLNPEFIELEITESLMMDDVEGTINKIQQLADLGFYIAIDDFGTGYSSLSYLSKLPANKLKIDQSFVKSVTKSDESKDIIRCINSLAKSLKMETIAEGVEDPAEIEFLKSLGCDEGQGYFYSKPLPASDFEQQYLKG